MRATTRGRPYRQFIKFAMHLAGGCHPPVEVGNAPCSRVLEHATLLLSEGALEGNDHLIGVWVVGFAAVETVGEIAGVMNRPDGSGVGGK